VGQRRHRRSPARARVSVHRAYTGRELPRAARQPRQLSRKHTAGAPAVRARGERGRARARLRPRHRPTASRRAARERRAHARDDGDLQRMVRPDPDAASGRRGPDRRSEAPALGRLDPYLARSRRDRARLHEVGRSTGIGRSCPGSDRARRSDRHHLAAGTRLRVARRGAPGRRARGSAAAARARPVSRRGARGAAGRSRVRSYRAAAGGAQAAPDDRPRIAGPHRFREAGRARRARRRCRAHRYQDGRYSRFRHRSTSREMQPH